MFDRVFTLFDPIFAIVFIILLMVVFVSGRLRNNSPVDRILAKKKRENTWLFRGLRADAKWRHDARHGLIR